MEILKEKNIYTNCESIPKDEVIKKLGQVLVNDGYVLPEYVNSMLAKEEVFNTAIGNAVAIPHCVEDGRQWIKESGIAVMIFPKGVNWGEEEVKIVIAIAGKADEQVNILMKIAMLLSSEEEVEAMLNDDAHAIYEKFTQD